MINKPKNTLKKLVTTLFAMTVILYPSQTHAKTDFFIFSGIFNIFNTTQTLLSYSSVPYNITTIYEDANEKIDEEKMEKNEDKEQAQRIDEYFKKRDMPLAGYGKTFVDSAKKYNIDPRLLAAIGVRESSGGKRLMNNNPFGWGGALIKFKDFSEAIDVVSMNLGGHNPNTAKYYKDADTMEKLWYYNGTVIPTYPEEVIAIMEMM